MNHYTCHPIDQPLDATVTLPGSKSITNRALIAAALADGNSLLTGILLAEDTRLMIDALRTLGIAITLDEAGCAAEVSGCGGHLPESETKLFCGNAGTVMRFCTALAALGHGRYELDGNPRMRARPIAPLTGALQTLGAGIEYLGREGFPPLIVRAGGLRGGHVVLNEPESSQFISALLLAAPYYGRELLLEIRGRPVSYPYVRITTDLMNRFGVAVLEQCDETGARFVVEAPQRYQGTHFAVEPDASGAGYFLAAAAVAGGRVSVEGLGTDSVQGDVRIVDVLEQMGCRVDREPHRLTVHGPPPGERLHGVDVDMRDMPDMVQTLAVVALFARGDTVMRNVGNLRLKETDRLAALQSELIKLGAQVDVAGTALRIMPSERPTAAVIETYNDHRMAMSFTVAGLRCHGLTIQNPECCAKTFPDFFRRFERMTKPQRRT